MFFPACGEPNAQMHGRVGQPQAGVDIYGHDRVEGVFVGVQCKGKDQGYDNPLTAAELRDEVKKAISWLLAERSG